MCVRNRTHSDKHMCDCDKFSTRKFSTCSYFKTT